MASAKKTLAGERVGIFALDPGRTTGVAMGSVMLEGSTEEIFKRDPLDVFQVDCNDQKVLPFRAEVAGAAELAEEYLGMEALWAVEEQIAPANIFFVFEDFVLNRQPASYDREGISPARVMSTIFGCLVQYRVNFVPQQASLAKQRWSQDRMRRAGIWVPGLQHGQDAVRHAALWVAQQMG